MSDFSYPSESEQSQNKQLRQVCDYALRLEEEIQIHKERIRVLNEDRDNKSTPFVHYLDNTGDMENVDLFLSDGSMALMNPEKLGIKIEPITQDEPE